MTLLQRLQQSCYTPYSDKPSMCVVRSKEGNHFPGVRLENVSYPLTIEAVQTAVFSCLSEKEKPEVVFMSEPENNELAFWEREYNLSVQPLVKLAEVSFFPVTETVEKKNIPAYLNKLLVNAITPHSNFQVAALLKTDDGYVSGVNIECSQWNLGLCAERVAIGKALSYGITELQELYILTDKGEYSSPCGACRQVLLEHMPHQAVYLYHGDHTHSVHYTSDLLPYSFRSSTLGQYNP